MTKRPAPRAKRTAVSRQPAAREHRPEVIVEFVFDKGLLFISVRNIGDKPAVAISVKFRQKLLGLGGAREVSAQPLFRNIEFLGPQREIATLLDRSSSYLTGKQPTKVAAVVSYKDLEGNQYSETISHDLEIYRDLVYALAPGDG